MNNTLYGSIDESLLTPYGPPSPSAYIIPVPDECIGIIIGKAGDNIRQLQQETGAKILVAKKEIPGTKIRNVFVEGSPERYEHVKRIIEAIVEERQKSIAAAPPPVATAPRPSLVTIEYPVPNNMIGLLIGRGGENLKKFMAKTKTMIHVPKFSEPGRDDRIVQIKGTKEQVDHAKRELDIYTTTFAKVAAAAQLRERQQAVSAISMYLPPSYPGAPAAVAPVAPTAAKPDEKKDSSQTGLSATAKMDQNAILEAQRQQQVQAEVAGYASMYQQYYANYDPLYAEYFQKQYQGNAGGADAAQRNAAAAVQEAYTNYSSYYNGYLQSGFVPPSQQDESGASRDTRRSGGR